MGRMNGTYLRIELGNRAILYTAVPYTSPIGAPDPATLDWFKLAIYKRTTPSLIKHGSRTADTWETQSKSLEGNW